MFNKDRPYFTLITESLHASAVKGFISNQNCFEIKKMCAKNACKWIKSRMRPFPDVVLKG